MKKPLRAAIYARVSTQEQDPQAQLEALREYICQRGFILHREYVDTVTGDFEKRRRRKKQEGEAYQALMEDVSKRRVDCVVVWKYDRFARSIHVLVADLMYFHSLGVEFISYTQNIDTTTPMGRFFYHIIASFAQFEQEMIVERVRAGLAHARAKGVVLGRQERDPEAKHRMAVLRSEGLSLRQIARREGYSPSGVLKILRKLEGSKDDHTP
jgi:DNA invertase Pin-like site-specific DNA recombinase